MTVVGKRCWVTADSLGLNWCENSVEQFKNKTRDCGIWSFQ